jgi:LysM repeat protein
MRWSRPILRGCRRRAASAPLAIAALLLTVCVAGAGCQRTSPPKTTLARAQDRTTLYPVQRGDTPERIAAWHGVPVSALRRLNDLDADEPLAPGRKLRLPARALPTHLVEPGDTLGALANAFGVEVVALAHVNAIEDPRRLAVGTVLRIPATARRTELKHTRATRREPPPVAAAPPAAATPSEADAALASAQRAFEAAQFEEALTWTERAQQALPASSRNEADQRRLAQTHLVRGMTEVALQRDDAARASFERALALDRTIELDPASVSPKVLDVFREASGH